MKNTIKINFVIPVWKKFYIDECFRNTLASLLSKNNLFALDRKNVKIIFCTRLNDVKLIKNQKLFKFIEKNFKIKFVSIDKILNQKKRRILHYAFYNGYLSVQNKKNSCFFNLNSDDIFADGSIRYLKKYFNIKNFCVFNSPIHCDIKKIHRKLSKYKKNEIIQVSPFNLQKISLQSMTKFCKNSVIENNSIGNLNPYYFLFEFKDYIIKKSLLSHPLLFRTKSKITKLKSFIDYAIYPQYINKGKMIKNLNTKYFLKVSPNHTSKKQYIIKKKKFSLPQYANFISDWAQNYHIKLIDGHELLFKKKKIKLNSSNLKFVNRISKVIVKSISIKHSYKNHPHWGVNHNYHRYWSFGNILKRFFKISEV